MENQITWDGRNHCLIVIFVRDNSDGGSLSFHHERGVTLHLYGLETPVRLGDTLLATDNGISVIPGPEPEEETNE